MELFDRPEFARALARLSVAFDKTISDPKADLYWARVQDVPIELFVRATDYCIDHCQHFPRISELRSACDLVGQRDVPLGGAVPIFAPTPERPYWCEDCSDTGFVIYQRVGDVPVDVARRCPCALSNPVLVAERKARRRYSSSSMTAGKELTRRRA